MLPDLDSLRLFVRTAELGSLTKAAAANHIAVAAASRRIALLEHLCRAKLLVRTARGVELTPAGEVLRVHAAKVVEDAFGLQAAMTAHAAHKHDTLRLIANTSAVMWFLPGDLATFKAAHPDWQLELSERKSREVVEAVQAGEADLGIFNYGPSTEGLCCHAYRPDRLAVIVPRDHPLRGAEIAFVDILDYDLVGLDRGSALAQLLAEKASALSRAPRLRLEMKSFLSACRMVQSGLGIGLLPMQAVTETAALLDLRAIPLSDAWATRSLWICVRDNGHARPALKALLEHLIPALATRGAARTDMALASH